MTIVIVLFVVVLLGLSVIVAAVRDQGPTPTDVAIGYGRALAERDFDALYRMTDEDGLHGRNRPHWVAEQRSRPHRAMLGGAITAESTVVTGDRAHVLLRLDPDGGAASVDLALRQRIWVVTAFTPSSTPADPMS